MIVPVSHRFATKLDPSGRSLVLPDGSTAAIRLSQEADRGALLAFHRSLSDTSVYFRYFSPVSIAWRTGAARMDETLHNIPDEHLTLIVEHFATENSTSSIIGVGRLVMCEDHQATAELAMTIRDEFQGMGIGVALLDALIDTARRVGLHALVATVLTQNRRMLQLCHEHGFHSVAPGTGGTIDLVLPLQH